MRVVYITAGTGGMYCGACARDAGLARALIRLGCDVQLIPLYMPLKLDADPPPGTTRPFFGGVSVFLEQRFAFFRHTHRLFDRLLDSRLLLRCAARLGAKTDPRGLGPMTLSVLKGEHGYQRKELDKLLGFLEAGPRPDVVNITNSLLSGIVPALKRVLPVPVVCTLQGEDAFVEDMPEPYRAPIRDRMRENAREIDAFISPGERYAATMAEFLAVPGAKVRTIRSGIEVDEYPAAPRSPRDPFTVAYLSRITPGKGLDVLLEAAGILAADHQCDVRLRVAGQRLDRAFWKSLDRSRVEYCGEPDFRGKIEFLQGCSVFCSPSRQAEVHATAAMEAMAVGVPAVAPDAGVFPEVIEATGGGVLFPPGDPGRLAAALAALMNDPDRADAIGLAAGEGIRLHYSARQMADRTLELYAAVYR